jgi:hypothetical protein
VQFRFFVHDVNRHVVGFYLLPVECGLFFALQNITEIRNSHKAKVPCFDFEKFTRSGLKEFQVSEECGVVTNSTHLPLP